jgi:hypothetical protein
MPSAPSDHEFRPSIDLFCFCSGAESEHNDREAELWSELQTTQMLLKSAEEHIKEKEENKAKFMETINKAAVSNKSNSKCL